MSLKQDQLVESVKLLINQIKIRENEIELIKERCNKIKSRINYIRTFHEDAIELTDLLKSIPSNFIDATPFQENGQVRELELENAELQLSLEEHQAAMEIIMTKYREQIHALIRNNRIDWPKIRQQECHHDLEVRSSIDQICEIGELMWRSLEYDSKFIFDLELVSSLRLENQGLEKMLSDSSSFGNTCTWNLDETELNDDQSTTAMSESTTSGLGGLATPDDDAPLWMSSSFCSIKNVPAASDRLLPVDDVPTNDPPPLSTSFKDHSETVDISILPHKNEYKQCNGHANGHSSNFAAFENGNPLFINNENVIPYLSNGRDNADPTTANNIHKTNLNKLNGSMDSLEFDNLSESTLDYESDVTLASDAEPAAREVATIEDLPSPDDDEDTPCALVYITSPINGISNKIIFDGDKTAATPKSWMMDKNLHRSNDLGVVNQVVNNNENNLF